MSKIQKLVEKQVKKYQYKKRISKKFEFEVGCEDCSWLGMLVDVISDIINEEVVSVCPNCRSFPLSPKEEEYEGYKLQ